MPAGEHLHWGAEALWQQLEPELPGLSVEVVARTDSTNLQLVERARRSGQPREPDAAAARPPPGAHGRRSGDTQPCLLVAEAQTRGRGRQGRHWESCAGASLTFSLSLPMAPADWSGLSLAVGVALAEALDAQPPAIGLKWPNDLWLLDAPGRGRKLGGVLIETVNVGARRMAVVGIGLNVRPLEAAFLQDFSSGFACLQEIDPDIAAPAALERLALPLVRALREFERSGFAPFAERFARRDLLRGEAVVTTAPEVPEGLADGVEADGRLRVRAGQALHHLVGGDVSVRPAFGRPGAA